METLFRLTHKQQPMVIPPNVEEFIRDSCREIPEVMTLVLNRPWGNLVDWFSIKGSRKKITLRTGIREIPVPYSLPACGCLIGSCTLAFIEHNSCAKTVVEQLVSKNTKHTWLSGTRLVREGFGGSAAFCAMVQNCTSLEYRTRWTDGDISHVGVSVSRMVAQPFLDDSFDYGRNGRAIRMLKRLIRTCLAPQPGEKV